MLLHSVAIVENLPNSSNDIVGVSDDLDNGLSFHKLRNIGYQLFKGVKMLIFLSYIGIVTHDP